MADRDATLEGRANRRYVLVVSFVLLTLVLAYWVYAVLFHPWFPTPTVDFSF